MLYRTQRGGSRTVPGTALDRDVYISVAQVAIVLCVFFCGLYLDCVRMPAPLFNMFFSAGCTSRAALTAFYSGEKKNYFEAKI